MNKLTVPPFKPFQSFLDAEVVTNFDNLEADVCILGIPFSDPYTMEEIVNDQTNAPTAIRQQWQRAIRCKEHYDFDLGGTLFDGKDVKLVDCGDIPGNATDLQEHYRQAEAAVRCMLKAGALPIILGGDHGIPIPVMRAYDEIGDITLIHVDAHIDWRDNINGAKEGYSSTIRRASEMEHIGEIYQIGMRSVGSARPEEVTAAYEYGAKIFTDIQLKRNGIEAILEMIPDNGKYYITIDADGLDPAIAPAVAGPAPGGLSYHDIRTLIQSLVKKGKVVGMDIVEITPSRDVNEITSVLAGRLIANLVGTATREGYFD